MSDDIEEAVRSGDLATVTGLLRSNGELVSGSTTTGMPLLEFAALLGTAAIVQAFIDAGAEVDVRDRLGSTPLGAAASSGRVAVVRTLLSSGADPNVEDNEGKISSRPIWQCLFSAHSNIDTLRELLRGGANTSGADEHGYTLRDWATPDQLVVLLEADDHQ